jgi:allantoin racemase
MPRSSYESYYELLQKDYELVKRADTEVVIRDVPTGLQSPELVTYFGLRQANEREILKAMLQAQREGFDAVAGACFSDGAIRAAGNLMDIPVVGPGETSMYLARMMGKSFAIIDSGPASIPGTEHQIDELNMRSSVISYRPVRCLTLDSSTFLNCLGGEYNAVIEDFKKVAQGCVEDGADVLIAGCGLFSPMLSLSKISDVGGAPIIDPMQVSLKFAEMMVDFRAAGMPILSSRGFFSKPSKEDIQNGCKSLGLI